MRITLITGFLGAGKTTFLRRFLASHTDARTGAIINDLSELEVDGELVRMGHHVTEEAGTLVSLTDGSISGNRRDALVGAILKMKAAGLEHILIETSGGTEPQLVIDTLETNFPGTLHTVATFLDARALLADFDGGKALLEYLEAPSTRITAEGLMAGQLRCASLIVLTKLDLIPETQLAAMLRILQGIHPAATMVGAAHGNLDPAVILASPAYAIPREASLPSGERESDIGSRVIRDARPLHPQRFHDLYRERLGIGMFRSKGFLWFASRPAQVLLWNQAGGAMGLEFIGTWKAEVLAKDTRLLAEEKAALAGTLAEKHPLFGDRSCELTLIGHERDLEVFGNEMLQCFCTGQEIEHWQSGGDFPDPWPANLKQMG